MIYRYFYGLRIIFEMNSLLAGTQCSANVLAEPALNDIFSTCCIDNDQYKWGESQHIHPLSISDFNYQITV
jgi:hypothetical protein